MSYYTTNIQLGSEGDDVKRWQEYLKNNGHSMLNVNGTFDDDTLIATQEFQTLNGLGESGVVDDSTWRKAGFTKNTQTPPQTTVFDYASALDALDKPNYDTTKYEDTAAGKSSYKKYEDAMRDVRKHGSFRYGNQEQLKNIMQSILERKPFTYNFNEDAFYQMYKDKYQKQGKMAAANVMGQAAALTGGYGNSYAATAGNQAYLGYLENLNDIIPELYQMAYDKYSQEGQDMYNQYGLLSDDYDRQRASHVERYQQLVDAANAARSDYYSGAESFYDAQDRSNQAKYDEYELALKQIEGDKPKKTTLTPAQWNEIFDKADEMAMNGEGALALYVNTLVNAETISPDAAADLMNQYFPLK